MKKPLRVAVIGVGHMGRHHARIYGELKDCELVAIVDKDIDRAREIAQKYGGEAFASVADVKSELDAVTVAVPTVYHAEVAIPLMERGVPVLVEKPLAPDTVSAKQLLDASRKHNCLLQVGHSERFNPVVQAMLRMEVTPRFIETSRISPFTFRSADIGVVFDMMIHDIDIVLHLVQCGTECSTGFQPVDSEKRNTGFQPAAKCGTGFQPVNPSRLNYSIDAVGVSVLGAYEDVANARIRFGSNGSDSVDDTPTTGSIKEVRPNSPHPTQDGAGVCPSTPLPSREGLGEGDALHLSQTSETHTPPQSPPERGGGKLPDHSKEGSLWGSGTSIDDTPTAEQIVVNLTASRLALKTERRIRIFAPSGYLSMDYQKKSGVAIKIADNLDLIRMAKERNFEDLSQMQSLDFGSMVNIEPIEVDDVEPLRAEIESFLESVRSGSAATGKTGLAAGQAGLAGVSAEDGYAAVEMAERITNIIKDQAWTTAPA